MQQDERVKSVPAQYDMERWFTEMLRLNMYGYNTCLPCVVEAVNAQAQTVDVRPLLQSYLPASNTSFSRALIPNVPFWVYRAGDTYITLPIKPGDTGLAIFCQRDITNWKNVGGEVPLQSNRVMDYNDAFFLPYFGAIPQAISDYNPDYIEIVKNGKKITVQDGTLNAPDYHIECASIHATGTITSDTDCISGTISGKSHVHGGVQGGPSTTGEPQ